ncbi:hypothetical protein SAMN05444162_3587 [Paenibacillaceae bacterium GAS479]|nr:hypothetical protein SAMN05444162_3587 [Paenibacillaceae bacterium GAS479]
MKQNDEAINGKPENLLSQLNFSKAQLLESGLYQLRRDLLSALLEDNHFYNKSEVDSLIGTYLNKEAV